MIYYFSRKAIFVDCSRVNYEEAPPLFPPPPDKAPAQKESGMLYTGYCKNVILKGAPSNGGLPPPPNIGPPWYILSNKQHWKLAPQGWNIPPGEGNNWGTQHIECIAHLDA
jgi:hypothetical protein